MQSLTKSFCSSVSQVMEPFLCALSEKFKLDKTQVLEFWNASVEEQVKVKTKTTTAKGSRTKKSDTPQCEHIFTKGNPETRGTRCKTRCADGLTTCKKHAQKEKSAVSKKKPTKERSEKKVLEKMEEKKPTVSVVKNNRGNHVVSETDLLYDQDALRVCGKQLPDGSKGKLTEADVEECKRMNVNYDPSCVEAPPPSVEKKEETDEEEEEEETEEKDEEVELEA
jgi:hypothetical protein